MILEGTRAAPISNRLPGVEGVGLALYNPLTDNWGELVLVAGHPLPAAGERAGASWDRVSASYLQNLGIKIVRGRYFAAADNETAENVAERRSALLQLRSRRPRSSRLSSRPHAPRPLRR